MSQSIMFPKNSGVFWMILLATPVIHMDHKFTFLILDCAVQNSATLELSCTFHKPMTIPMSVAIPDSACYTRFDIILTCQVLPSAHDRRSPTGRVERSG